MEIACALTCGKISACQHCSSWSIDPGAGSLKSSRADGSNSDGSKSVSKILSSAGCAASRSGCATKNLQRLMIAESVPLAATIWQRI